MSVHHHHLERTRKRRKRRKGKEAEEEEEEEMKNAGSVSPPSSRASKRQRRVPTRFEDAVVSNATEAKMLAQALKNSEAIRKLEFVELPEAKVFYPTKEQFANPTRYIASIREEAEPFGCVKIVPPKGWNPPDARRFVMADPSHHPPFPSKLQCLHRLQEGKRYGDGPKFSSLREFEEHAQTFGAATAAKLRAREKDPEDKSVLEREYWRLVEMQTEPTEVVYPNDLDTLRWGSGFPKLPEKIDDLQSGALNLSEECRFEDEEYYRKTSWNPNNLPHHPGSLLRHLKGQYNGLNVPWLYVGMLFSTFAWHNEDNYLYSMSYLHYGAPKQWYCLAGSEAHIMESAMREVMPKRFQEEPDLFYALTTMVSPSVLRTRGAHVHKILQNPGEFVITFPQAYHGGFSYGYNCGEAVNFALPNWISHGCRCAERYRRYARASPISLERLIMKLVDDDPTQHTVESSKAVAEAISKLRDEQNTLRRSIFESGLNRAIRMPNNHDERDGDFDERRQCVICKHMCHIAGVVCECNSQNIVCLRHHQELCSCPPQRKCFLFWYTMQDLSAMAKKAQANVAALEAAEAKK